MRLGSALLLGAAATTAGCNAESPRPGMGWSRAPDLSVYSAMTIYGDIARQQAILCSGFNPLSVESHWQEDFGAREAAVTSVLAARHGADAVDRAEAAAVATRRVTCPDVPTLGWRHHYARLLRLLETRLGLI